MITLTQEQAARLVKAFGAFAINPIHEKGFEMLVRPAIFQQVLTNKSFADCNDLACAAVAYLDLDEYLIDEFERIARNLLDERRTVDEALTVIHQAMEKGYKADGYPPLPCDLANVDDEWTDQDYETLESMEREARAFLGI